MNCYVCAARGEERAAVGLCPHCLAGVCLKHLDEARRPGAGGLQLGCRHGLITPEARPTGSVDGGPRPAR